MPDGTLGPESSTLMPGVRRGRGATTNPGNRFESAAREAFDDGWQTLQEAFAEMPPLPTTLTRDTARSALSWNASPDIGFDRAVNPYRGCEHGCVYCYARPSHAYLGLSPGLDFETKLLFKPEVASLLEKELRKPGYTVRPIALGSNTDPYQPVEKRLQLTRALLEVMERFGHPLTIVTKSAGVLRDIDILSRLAERNLVRVALSITTLDAKLARAMEPRAAAPHRRLGALEALTRAGIPTVVMAAPMIPAVNDMELERILERAAAAGATRAAYTLLRLPLEIAEIFEAWLQEHMPDRAARVLSLVKQTRGGRIYDSDFAQRMTGSGAYAEMLAHRFRVAVQRLQMNRGAYGGLDCSQFCPPDDGKPKQMSLF